MHICVLGAGVIGVTSSYCLLKEGHQVTLIDAMDSPGRGASFGNGAQLSYSYVAPLADPSIWTKWPYYLFSSSSPLTLRPSADMSLWRWLSRFLAACKADRVRRTTVDLLSLAFFSRRQLALLLDEVPIDFQHRTAGKLVMFSNKASLEAAREQVAFQAGYGCRQKILYAEECFEVEPSLATSRRKWAGGVFTGDEEVGDCARFCEGLVAHMTRLPAFRFLRSTKAMSATVVDRRLTSVQTDRERIAADAFVLAMGVESAAFARNAGFSLPVYPLKGYSITVPVTDPSREATPSVSITDLSKKIVYARVGDQLRVAGRVELVGMDETIPKRVVDELKASTAELFPRGVDLSKASPWAGFRPATPTGLPLVGPSPIKGLYLNVGHGSLGWTLACGSAALLTQQIDGRIPSVNPSPFLLRA